MEVGLGVGVGEEGFVVGVGVRRGVGVEVGRGVGVNVGLGVGVEVGLGVGVEVGLGVGVGVEVGVTQLPFRQNSGRAQVSVFQLVPVELQVLAIFSEQIL